MVVHTMLSILTEETQVRPVMLKILEMVTRTDPSRTVEAGAPLNVTSSSVLSPS